MKHDECYEIIKNLEFDKEKVIYSERGNTLSILRPFKLSNRFKDYDKNKNFQIFLQEGERRFRPNYLRVMIDLNLRIRSRPNLKEDIALAFDNIFYGRDPDIEVLKLKNEHFEHFLNPIGIIANLSQLFIIEQEYCYARESKFEPPTLFYQGWIREFIDNMKEIDNLCMSVCSRRPPSSRYTKKEDKNHKDYDSGYKKLWYLK